MYVINVHVDTNDIIYLTLSDGYIYELYNDTILRTFILPKDAIINNTITCFKSKINYIIICDKMILYYDSMHVLTWKTFRVNEITIENSPIYYAERSNFVLVPNFEEKIISIVNLETSLEWDGYILDINKFSDADDNWDMKFCECGIYDIIMICRNNKVYVIQICLSPNKNALNWNIMKIFENVSLKEFKNIINYDTKSLSLDRIKWNMWENLGYYIKINDDMIEIDNSGFGLPIPEFICKSALFMNATVHTTETGEIFYLRKKLENKLQMFGNETKKIVKNGDELYIFTSNKLSKIKELIIDYEFIIKTYLHSKKDCPTISIDINIGLPYIQQFSSLVQMLYRMNSSNVFIFQNVREFSKNVINYGAGSSRQIIDVLGEEIDEILLNKFSNVSAINIFELGMLIYFCHWECKMKINNLHPLFHHYLANSKTNHLLLLRKFKPNDYTLYENQYLEYEKDETKLHELELNNLSEYIEYIIGSDLSESDKACYKILCDGYSHYLRKNKYYSRISHYYIDFTFDTLIPTDKIVYDVFKFTMTHNTLIDNLYGLMYNMSTSFMLLSHDDILTLKKNLTGSKYYNGTITICLNYKGEICNEQKLQNTHFYFKTHYLDNETNHDIIFYTSEIDEDTNNIVDYFTSDYHANAYNISTCFTKLIINISPTSDNIDKIISSLIIEDNYMIN
jgi:hypothetical protein